MRHEEELVRVALGEPVDDPLAERRARHELRRRFHRPSHRRYFAVGLIPVAAAVGLVLLSVNISGGGALADALSQFRQVASGTPSIEDGQSLHFERRQYESETHTSVADSLAFTRLVLVNEDFWIDSDGSGIQRTTYLQARFASDLDRAHWVEAGSPQLPQPGDVVTDRFKSGEAPFYDVSGLSTDPRTLLEQLRAGVVVERPAGDEETFGTIGGLLEFGQATEAQKQALFTVAGELDGVTLVGNVSDPLGRSGVGLAVPGTHETTMLVFNADTADLLATETFAPGADPATATPTEWTAYQPVEVVSDEAAGTSG